MIPISLKRIAEISNGHLYGTNLIITEVSTDTRKVILGSLFVALVGNNFDGHNFAIDAVAKGASALLVHHLLPVMIPQVLVTNTRIAFGQLSAWVRQQLKVRVVALTGSSGKTSVKEMTASILRQCGTTLYTKNNLNNEFGVSMTLLRLTKEHKFAVIELGANHQTEISYATTLVRPEVALVNNLSAAHLEGFGSSLTDVANAKGEIFKSLLVNGTAIINADSNDLPNWSSQFTNKRVWRFSLHPTIDAEFHASNIIMRADYTLFVMHTPYGDIPIKLFLLGKHNIANAMAAAALSMSVNATLVAISKGLTRLRAIPGRLFPIRLAANQLLLDDSYNANVGSMTAAIKVLSNMPGFRVLVVGDIAELGDKAELYHRQIGEIAKIAKINCILSIGRFSHLISESSKLGEHFINKSLLINRLQMMLSSYRNITILIKGSHSTNMHHIVQRLREKRTC